MGQSWSGLMPARSFAFNGHRWQSDRGTVKQRFLRQDKDLPVGELTAWQVLLEVTGVLGLGASLP
jgi:hypothetical protein